ncbi:MAG: type IV pilus modification protein PilV [Nitrospiria bacterium]
MDRPFERISSLKNERGFTFIEVLVAMFIVTFGLLALASMQVTALKGAAVGGNTTHANQLARDVVERVLKNATNVGSYDGMQTSTNQRQNCPTLVPSPACLQDFTVWQNTITALPNGDLTIASIPGPNFDTVNVNVSWQDPSGSHAVVLPFQVAP